MTFLVIFIHCGLGFNNFPHIFRYENGWRVQKCIWKIISFLDIWTTTFTAFLLYLVELKREKCWKKENWTCRPSCSFYSRKKSCNLIKLACNLENISCVLKKQLFCSFQTSDFHWRRSTGDKNVTFSILDTFCNSIEKVKNKAKNTF